MTKRIAFHIHSDWSYDGHWTLTALASFFERRGYDGMLVTDHDRGFTEERRLSHRCACAAASSSSFAVIPGIEYSDSQNCIHLLTCGDVPFQGENQPPLTVLKAVKKFGGAAVLAHPTRNEAWKHYSPDWTPLLSGIELWNRKTDGWAPSREANWLIEQTSQRPFFGLDFHRINQAFPLAMQIEIDAPRLDEAAVSHAIRTGAVSAQAFGQPSTSLFGRGRMHCLRAAEVTRRFATRTIRRCRSLVIFRRSAQRLQ